MKNKSGWPRIEWARLLGWVLFVSLALSVAFAAHKVAVTPADTVEGIPGQRLQSDYVLMLVQCIAGLVVMFLPGLLAKKLCIEIPHYIFVLYYIFLYCAIYLGEVQSFYYLVPHWDTMLHGFSAVMLGALGFSLVSILNNAKNVEVRLNPLFEGLFAFCFALTVGALWEIYEFAFDSVLGLNMQKFRLESGEALVGRAALADTMKDIIVDAAGALLVSVVGALTIKKKRE